MFERPSAYHAAQLRHELNERNYRWAKRYALSHALTYGQPPCVIYAPDEHGRHGNFLDASYREMLRNPAWERRMQKVFTQGRRSLPAAERRWRELDSAHSSDALLMNIFCHPGTLETHAVRSLLGIDGACRAEFGVRVRIPFKDGMTDRTEVDLALGELLIEAKLTESNFQTAPHRLVDRYRDLEEVFDLGLLPVTESTVLCYQLVRGVLAAFAQQASFCVLADARRPDLVEAWYLVMRAVLPVDLRHRLKLLTWQELAEALPAELQIFLAEKYGIVPRAVCGQGDPQLV
jgi:hypothetical protein